VAGAALLVLWLSLLELELAAAPSAEPDGGASSCSNPIAVMLCIIARAFVCSAGGTRSFAVTLDPPSFVSPLLPVAVPSRPGRLHREQPSRLEVLAEEVGPADDGQHGFVGQTAVVFIDLVELPALLVGIGAVCRQRDSVHPAGGGVAVAP
jgi:hypothetical protein